MSDDSLSSASQDSSAASGGRLTSAVLGKTFEEMLAELQAQDERVRSQAAISLGSLGDQRALDPLVAALSDQHWYVRWNAAEALGKLGNQQAVDPLLAIFQGTEPTDSPSRNTRIAAVKALGKLKDERVVPILLDALDPADPDTYRAISTALENLGAAKKIPISSTVETYTIWDHRLVDDAAIIIAFLASVLVCVFLALPWLDINGSCAVYQEQPCSDVGSSYLYPGPQAASAYVLAGGGVMLTGGSVKWTDDTGDVSVNFQVSPSQAFQLPLLWLAPIGGVAMIVLSGWLFWVRNLPRKRRQFHWWLLGAALITLAIEVYSLFLASSNLAAINLTSTVNYTTGTPGDILPTLTAAPDLGYWLGVSAAAVVCLIALMRARIQRRRR